MSSYVTELTGLAKRHKRGEQDIFDVSDAAEVGVEIIEHLEESIAKLEEQNKRLKEDLYHIKNFATERYNEAIKEKDELRKLTSYERGALNGALTSSSKLVGKGKEKDDE